ncbi:hypothetical protein Ahy_A02g005359 [Arachis hypogaea]|uniref:DUF4220 domain-containing protein n=1 Tax=Arachis hypogaea TaxID=3818 RepID=A0A445E6Z5_ARAHY|nr:hypothetical protein Ahy_A02g005359 [Arachis hypogaea]
MEIFPAHVRHVWNEWELRTLVLISLTWQVILVICGSWRKHASGGFISFVVWVTYLSADWLATVSLGTLANDQGDAGKQDRNHALQALWAPFLLLHLGGPDTITAYALEDNTLWLRHLLGLLVQVSVAFYIYLRSWSSSALTFIAIPVFVSGIIKYAERTWVLRSASPDQLEDSLLSAPAIQAPKLNISYGDLEIEYVDKGYYLLPVLKRLYANLSLTYSEGQRAFRSVMGKEEKDGQQHSNYAFKLVEVQLGFLYDLLYTKATSIYSLPGLILRLISVLSIVSALASCVVLVDSHNYSRVDIYITYCLFIGAISLELYALVSLVFSDWTLRWLIKKQSSLQNFISWVLYHFQKRWSGKLAQHNLLNFCMKKRLISCIGSDFLFRSYFVLELYRQRAWEDADADLKQLIFQNLVEKQKEYDREGFDYNFLKELLSYKGYNALLKNKCKEIGWSVEVEFDHSVLIWHIATNICYHSMPDKYKDHKREAEASKKISNYMLYLLLMRPVMLPKWIDRITHVRNTFREAIRILQRKHPSVKDAASASRVLIQMHTQSHQPLEQLSKEKRGKSLLHEGCRLASQIEDLGCSWEMICEVWIEMLAYAASQCDWTAHAQQLRRGGEFLTHVCLLMADLGLNEQFDIGRKGVTVESQNDGWGCATLTIRRRLCHNTIFYKLMVKKEHVEDEEDEEKQSNYAFKLVEVQLGFLYDLLYTKATTIYTLPGLIFRFISVLSTLSALASCVVFLNLYALVSLLFSDWTLNWLVNKQSSLQNFICRALSRCQKRWSGELAQHNLLNFCMKKRVTRCLGNDFLFRSYFLMELYWERTWEDVDTDLKQFIFIQLKRNQREYCIHKFVQ